MDSYALAAFTLAALLALMILALNDANERSRIAPIGLAVSAAFWTVPPVALRVIGALRPQSCSSLPYQPSDFGSC